MGLIAREIEKHGIPTICLTSALSITRAVNPPRAVYVDFPLGHTTGKANDRPLQRRIMIDTLSALDSIQVPGDIRMLPYQWAQDDAWKDTVMRPQQDAQTADTEQRDDRLSRTTKPQYQNPADRRAAEAALAAGGCRGCVFLEAPE